MKKKNFSAPVLLAFVSVLFFHSSFAQKKAELKTVSFTPENAAILLVDHQKSTMDWIYSQNRKNVENNLRMLARLGTEFTTPLLITTTMEEYVGPTFEGIQQLAPKAYASRVKRGGTINCFLDQQFKAAVQKLGRKNLIIAGLTTDICLLQTVKGAIAEGYNVIVVADASGSMTALADEISFDYFRQIGVNVYSANAVLSELYPDFGTENGKKAMQISIDEIVSKLGK